MKRFQDSQGSEWDVVVGRASWGVFLFLFVPVGGGEARQVTLSATSADEAEAALARTDASELRRLLGDSKPRVP
jgi:hypothetical protein